MATQDNPAGGTTRPRFFDRQQLTAADLNAAVDYVRARQRRHNRFVIGWGVVCGAEVTPVDGAPWSVAVGEGFALTPAGEEVHIPAGAPAFDVCQAARACLNIPGPCPDPDDLTPGDDPVPDEGDECIVFADRPENRELLNPLTDGWATFTGFGFDGEQRSTNQIIRFGDRTGLNLQRRMLVAMAGAADAVRVTIVHFATPCTARALDAAGNVLDAQTMTADGGEPQTLRLEGAGIASLEIEAPQNEALLLEICREVTATVGVVFLALCPDEEALCHTPAVPEACLPGDGNLQASRIREGYCLRVLCDLPPSHAMRPSCDDLERIVCRPAHVPCPTDPGDPDCVVIATLAIGHGGITAIDLFRHRRRLMPQWLLSDLAACRCVTEPRPSQISEPPQRTLPTDFTRTAGFTFIGGRTTIVDPIRTIGPRDRVGRRVIDRSLGETIPVEDIQGIGRGLGRRLRAAGIETVADFAEMPSERAATVLRASEVRVAGLQERARAMMTRPA